MGIILFPCIGFRHVPPCVAEGVRATREEIVMRVLFTTQPVPSHLHPLVPLARALEDVGHEVAFATAPAFHPSVEASGFRAFPAGMDCLPGQERAPVGRVRADGDPAYSVLTDFFGDLTARRMTPDLIALCRSWRPDLVVRDPVEFGGCVAAECCGILHLTGRENRFLPPERWVAYLGEPMAQLRRAHGLPPDPELAMLFRYLALAWVPPRFVTAAAIPAGIAFGSSIAPTMHFLRPVPFDRSGDETLPAWVGTLPGRPTVYATLGTVFNEAPAIFAAIYPADAARPILRCGDHCGRVRHGHDMRRVWPADGGDPGGGGPAGQRLALRRARGRADGRC